MAKQKLYTKTLALPDGTRKYFRGKTQEEAERKLLEARYRMGQGIRIQDNTTFGEFAEMWYNIYKKPRLKSPNSRAEALNILNNHLLPYLTAYPLKAIAPVHIQAVMNALHGKSATLNRKVAQYLRAIFQTAVDNGLIVRSPVTQSIAFSGTPAAEKVPLTLEQAQTLLSALRETNAFCFVFLALNTGLRRGELLGLMWEDIDLDAGELHVRHNAVFDGARVQVSEALKTASARRTIPLPLPLTRYLAHERQNSRSDYVIPMASGAPMTRNAFRAMWRLVSNRTAGEGRPKGSAPRNHGAVVRMIDFRVTPHLLRHTYITRLFDAGLDIKEIQYLAGHKTPDMTLRVYTHYLLAQRRAETADKVRAGLGPVAEAFIPVDAPKEVQHRCNTKGSKRCCAV